MYKYVCNHEIMKTMCCPAYHQNGVMSTYALSSMMYMMNHTSCTKVRELPKCIVVITRRAHLLS